MLSPRQFNLLLTWVRPKLGSIWLMVRADKRYGFDVIPDLRLETELDPSRWALLCNTTGHGVTRKETEEGYRFSHMSTLGEKMTGRARHELCIKSGVERTKENSVKLELVCPRGDKWADVRGLIFHDRPWEVCVLWRVGAKHVILLFRSPTEPCGLKFNS